jgi:hypothetical protein
VPKGKTISLILEGPINKLTKFKAKLFDLIKELVNQNAGQTFEEEILSNHVTINIFESERSPGRIVGTVINKRSSPLIRENARLVLNKLIKTKAEKCRSLDFNGPKWLALYNDYFLAEPETYRQVMKESDIAHDFEKIFLVNSMGSVEQIYPH